MSKTKTFVLTFAVWVAIPIVALRAASAPEQRKSEPRASTAATSDSLQNEDENKVPIRYQIDIKNRNKVVEANETLKVHVRAFKDDTGEEVKDARVNVRVNWPSGTNTPTIARTCRVREIDVPAGAGRGRGEFEVRESTDNGDETVAKSTFFVQQQAAPPIEESTMEQRVGQLHSFLDETEDAKTAGAILDLLESSLTANLWVLPGKDEPELTAGAHQITTDRVLKSAKRLEGFVRKGKIPGVHGRAIDLIIRIQELSETARACAEKTKNLGEGDKLPAHFQPLLNEQTGHEVHDQQADIIIKPGFSVKLRGPFIAPYIRDFQEDVHVTAPIAPGECVVIFKETRGLMLRLVFVRMTLVADPWATPLLARGTLIPVWALQWVPVEYVKEWNICNVGCKIEKTVTQRVKQDVPLHYFWRYYPRNQ